MPRPYRMTRRTESADDTRRRIVRATYELHAQQGIAATSMRDIAARAEVAIGTVYHHFPTYDEVIGACGEYTVALTQPPDEKIFADLRGERARLHALADAQFAFYRRFPGFERVRADRGRFAQIDAFMRSQDSARRRMLKRAVAPRRVGRKALAVAFALLDVAVYRALTASGLAHGEAVSAIGGLLDACLRAGKPAPSPSPTPA